MSARGHIRVRRWAVLIGREWAFSCPPVGSFSCPPTDGQVRYWKATREAKQLVDARIWIDVLGGYRYVYLRDENKPKSFYERRLKESIRKRGQRAPRPSDTPSGGW